MYALVNILGLTGSNKVMTSLLYQKTKQKKKVTIELSETRTRARSRSGENSVVELLRRGKLIN